MQVSSRTIVNREMGRRGGSFQSARFFSGFAGLMAWLFALALMAGDARAQVNVLTSHNDIARTGQNLQETALTPANVNPGQFGKLFSRPVNGEIFAQPLYVSQIAIPGQGTHNVVYVATTSGDPNVPKTYGQYTGDFVYAFDADTNGGADANPLWQVSLLAAPAGTYTSNFGVLGTPAIDLNSKTMYLVSSDLQGSTAIYRLHALDITTGAEKFGGPVQIQASVPGTGNGGGGGILTFDPTYQLQRSGLLFLNGVVYVAFGSIGDQGPWHGWIFSYAVSPTTQTLQQIDVFCTTPNGFGGGVWMGGAGLAAEVNNPAKPYGRMFVATGNGSFGINPPTVSGQPFSNPSNAYGMSVLDLDLSGGVMTVEDMFSPDNRGALEGQDGDLGSGGPVLLPSQTLASGSTLNPLVQIGKSGMIYILDRNNLGGFNAAGDQVVQEVQTPIIPSTNWGTGVWGSSAYWNNNVYSGGTAVANVVTFSGSGNGLTAYSFVNGILSTAPTATGAEPYYFPGPTPSVSANNASNGMIWVLILHGGTLGTPGTLLAYDATLGTALYSSNTNASRDSAGLPAEFVIPTVANGKVFVGVNAALDVYGLLGVTQTAPAPVISLSSATQMVSITDLPTATIYYTTNGSTPTSTSPIYQNPFAISSNETITAIASVTGYIVSPPASASFGSVPPANPVFSLASGSYTGTQTLTITDSTPGAVIYYTSDGPVPTTASSVYTKPLSIPVSQTVQAIAVSPGGIASSAVSATYNVYTIDFSQGFTAAEGPMQFNGSTDLDDFRLQLTNGGLDEAGSAFYATPVNIQSFTTDFTFQLSNPVADGMTFSIQNVGPTALGGYGGYLGYGFPKSVAIKFDLYNNAGEGSDSTGLYIDGAIPTIPAIDLSSTGINLHSGDYIDAHIAYDGTNLTLTLTDAITMATWSHSFAVNIPAIVGGNTAYVGFTGGTGGTSSSQKLTSWTYLAGPPTPDYPGGFYASGLTLNGGAVWNGTRLRLTDGNTYEARSAFFTSPVNVQRFITSFDFQPTNPVADGMTFTIQNVSPTAVGKYGGYLGYGSAFPESVAIKFDLYSNAGEGPDSTGLYTDGALPTIPAINLSSTGINLHSGDIFNAQLAYDGATLTVVITDTATNATATQAYGVNIPSIVGSPTAYVGFTGGSGGGTAIQEILNWSYFAAAAN